MERPNKWLLLKVTTADGEEQYRVFGTWSGGYLDGDSWAMGSSIKEVVNGDEGYVCTTQSGNEYLCRYGMQGVAGAYNGGVLETLEHRFEKVNQKLEILQEDEAIDRFQIFMYRAKNEN